MVARVLASLDSEAIAFQIAVSSFTLLKAGHLLCYAASKGASFLMMMFESQIVVHAIGEVGLYR